MVGLMGGCATPALLDTVKPNEQVAIPCEDTTEEDLQSKGRSYTKKENYFMVEKSLWRKTGDYTLLGIGVPFAIATDITIYGAYYIGVPIAVSMATRHPVDFSMPRLPTYYEWKKEEKQRP